MVHDLTGPPIVTATVCGSTNVVDGRPHLIAVSWDGSGLASGFTIYIDGVKETVTSIVFDSLAAHTIVDPRADGFAQNLAVGMQINDNGNQLKGRLGFLQIDQTVRDHAYITNNFSPANPGPPPNDATAVTGTAFRLLFNEGSGTTVHDTGAIGTSLVGTITNFGGTSARVRASDLKLTVTSWGEVAMDLKPMRALMRAAGNDVKNKTGRLINQGGGGAGTIRHMGRRHTDQPRQPTARARQDSRQPHRRGRYAARSRLTFTRAARASPSARGSSMRCSWKPAPRAAAIALEGAPRPLRRRALLDAGTAPEAAIRRACGATTLPRQGNGAGSTEHYAPAP